MSEALLLPPEPPPNLSLGFGEITLRYIGSVPADSSRGLVPFYHFRILTREYLVAGHINFRIGNTEHVTQVAGHIGYEVVTHHRGHGYAFQACRAIAPFVRTIYPDVIITADPENLPSIRTIEKLGAQFLDVIVVPVHDPAFRIRRPPQTALPMGALIQVRKAER